MELHTVVDGMSFTECPRWHDDRLWFVDFYTHAVHSAREDGSDLRTELEVPAQPSGIGWLPDGRLIAVSALDQRILRREADGSVVTHADLSEHAPAQLNDMIVDETTGRAWVGNFGFDLMAGDPVGPTTLHRVDPDGSVHDAAPDLWFPNGSVLSGGVLLVDETLRQPRVGVRRARRRVARRAPRLGELRVAAHLVGAEHGARRGARGGARRVLGPRRRGLPLDRRRPGQPGDPGARGRRDRRRRRARTGVYACGLGGSDGRTLYLCTAPDFLAHNRRDTREAAIMATTVSVPMGWRSISIIDASAVGSPPTAASLLVACSLVDVTFGIRVSAVDVHADGRSATGATG